ncbi:MAG: hypothetical protein D4R63_03175, partial [Methylococcaceae bacterium]
MNTSRKKNKLPHVALFATCLVGGLTLPPVAMADAGLSLAEAVKMTLELSPTRFIQQQNVTSAKAGVSIQEGAFNYTPSAGASIGQTSMPFHSVMY